VTKKRRRRRRPSGTAGAAETVATTDEPQTDPERAGRRGPLLGSLLGRARGESPFPGTLASLGRGLMVVGSSPVLVVTTFLLVLFTWLGLVTLGLEGSLGRLVDLLAIPPISTQYDLGTAQSLFGLGSGFPLFLLASLAVRAVVTAILTGLVVEAVETGRTSMDGARRGLRVSPIVLAVNLLAVGIIITGNLILPVLGPGIGFLGFVAMLVGGLFFLVFVPIGAIREGRGLQESLRRSGRAAMMPGGRHLLLVTLYFLIALPLMVGLAPGGNFTTANPGLATWVFVLASNLVHLVFVAAFAYRWIVVEPDIPEQPVRRRRR
jgi:hypothetical protein